LFLVNSGGRFVARTFQHSAKDGGPQVDMFGMIDFSTPLSGMLSAESTVNQIATRVAQPATDTVDLSTEIVAMMAVKDSFAVDAKLAQTEDQMTQSALSVLA
jgi:hypothetical protein